MKSYTWNVLLFGHLPAINKKRLQTGDVMDKTVLIIEMPELSDEAVIGIHQFLEKMREAFESRYYYQIQPYYRQASQPDEREKPF